MSLMMCVFLSPLCRCKIVLFLSVAAFTPALVRRRLLCGFIKMKGRFDVCF